MGTGKQYDEEFKKQAIKLEKEIGTQLYAAVCIFFVLCIILQFTCPNLTKVRQWSIM